MRVDIGRGVRLFVDVLSPHLALGDQAMVPKPTLILMHGGPGMDHSGYRPAFEQFGDVAHVIAYDHRGNGRSDERDDATHWNLDTWADDVVALCDALEITDPIVLGNSFGGMVAMHYAGRHPQHPGAVVLSSTSAHMDRTLMASWFGRLGGPEAEACAEAFWAKPTPETTAEYLTICGPLYTQNEGNLFDESRGVRNYDVLNHYVNEIAPTMDLRPGLADIARPTLLLAGGLDPVCPIEGMREIASLIPAEHATLDVFEHCGHGVFRDDPTRAFASLRAFIERVTPSLG